MYISVRYGFTRLGVLGVCDCGWLLTTVGGQACVEPSEVRSAFDACWWQVVFALEDVGLEFYGWFGRVLRLEQFTGWRPIALIKEKRKKEKATLMV